MIRMAKTSTIKMPPLEQLQGRTIGRILIKMGVLTREKVHECLKIQKQRNGKDKIGKIFLELGLVDQNNLNMALAAQRGMQYQDFTNFDIPPEVLSQVPMQMANSYRVIPVEYDEEKNELTVAVDNADNFSSTDDLARLMGITIKAKYVFLTKA